MYKSRTSSAGPNLFKSIPCRSKAYGVCAQTFAPNAIQFLNNICQAHQIFRLSMFTHVVWVVDTGDHIHTYGWALASNKCIGIMGMHSGNVLADCKP